MKITQLEWRGSHRIEVSETEMSALRKIVDAGFLYLKSEENAWDDFSTGERKAMAYWHENPFSEEAEAAREKISQTAKAARQRRMAAKPQKRPKDGHQASRRE